MGLVWGRGCSSCLGCPSKSSVSRVSCALNVLRVVTILILWQFCFLLVNKKQVFQHLYVTSYCDL